MNKIIFILLLLCNNNLLAKTGTVTGLEIPRFVSLKSDDVNLRVGPSINYPIELKYVHINLPVEVIEEFDAWRKFSDHKKNIGWVHKSLIKGDRFILINNDSMIFKRPNGKPIGKVKINNVLKLDKCLKNWCKFQHKDINGWISKRNLWGVYENEIYKLPFYQPIINKFWKFMDGITIK